MKWKDKKKRKKKIRKSETWGTRTPDNLIKSQVLYHLS